MDDSSSNQYHIPVLLKQTIDALELKPEDTYFDATLGNGGHAEEVFKKFQKKVVIAGIDADPLAVEISKARLEILGASPKFTVLNFRKIIEALKILAIENPAAVLFDLGWNKSQFDTPSGVVGRGFSFQKDEPLVMTFGDAKNTDFTADDIVNNWDPENIATILDIYGEERFAKRIASGIVESREKKPIKTSKELSQIIYHAVPIWYRFKKIHPATRTFQALRIAVNDELKALEEGLRGSFEIIKTGGIVAVISFHSLEDRIVKKYFRNLVEEGKAQILNKKPIVSDEGEININPRSRSAKLRVLKKII